MSWAGNLTNMKHINHFRSLSRSYDCLMTEATPLHDLPYRVGVFLRLWGRKTPRLRIASGVLRDGNLELVGIVAMKIILLDLCSVSVDCDNMLDGEVYLVSLVVDNHEYFS